MAAHVIQQVRDALLAQLQATSALTALCPNVILHRERPFDISKTPYLSLQTEDDDETDASIGYPNIEDMMAHYTLTIVTYAIQSNDYEAQALSIRREVERVIYPAASPNTLGGLVLRLMRDSAHKEQDDLGGKPTYAIQLNITAHIRHLANQPDSVVY